MACGNGDSTTATSTAFVRDCCTLFDFFRYLIFIFDSLSALSWVTFYGDTSKKGRTIQEPEKIVYAAHILHSHVIRLNAAKTNSIQVALTSVSSEYM